MSDANDDMEVFFGEPPGNGKSLDEQIKELVGWYGIDDVRLAVARNTRKRSGRKTETDLSEILFSADEDAIEWLNGHDPFKLRSNYSIAKQAAKANPGHNYNATFRRFMKHLARYREPMVYRVAIAYCLDTHPYELLFRAHAALKATQSTDSSNMTGFVDEKREILKRYTETFGEPESELSWAQIEERLKSGTDLG